MPFDAIKNWQYFGALKKLKGLNKPLKKDPVKVNPAKQYLLFFNGTDNRDVDFFRTLHQRFESRGLKIKILAFVQTKEEVQRFSMALYNEKLIRWNQIPKPKIIELVQSRQFDILFNINPEQLRHLHYLAVASTADFKISTQTDLPNDFSLMVKTREGLPQKDIYEEMAACLNTLSV